MADEFNYQPPQNPEVQMAVNQALEEQKKKKKKKKLIILCVIAGIIVLGVIIGSLGSGSDDKKAETTKTTAAEVSASEEKKEEGSIGDFVCVVKEAKICKNWEGKDAVKITYSFTNNAKEAESFDLALMDDVYQDGIQLESTFISADDDDWGIDVKIKPGLSKEVSKVYLLRDKTTDLEIEISELISLSDEKITTTVKLSE